MAGYQCEYCGEMVQVPHGEASHRTRCKPPRSAFHDYVTGCDPAAERARLHVRIAALEAERDRERDVRRQLAESVDNLRGFTVSAMKEVKGVLESDAGAAIDWDAHNAKQVEVWDAVLAALAASRALDAQAQSRPAGGKEGES